MLPVHLSVFCNLSAPSNMANPKEKTPMCLVNELARFNKIQPEYKLLSEQGPAHSKVNIHISLLFLLFKIFHVFSGKAKYVLLVQDNTD